MVNRPKLGKIEGMKVPEHIQDRVVYLLALIALVQSIYPITAHNNLAGLIVYQFLYASMIVVGIILARDTPRIMALLAATGLTYLAAGIVYSFNPTETWALLLGYLTILPYLAMLTQVLLRFIFSVQAVTRDVLYAATAVYFLLGGLFVPIYGLIETLQPGSFIDGAATSGTFVHWQQFIYYSYATLTTLGYGDILPITMWARSAAALEAISGVLYIAILMARLVGLYAVELEENPRS